MKSEDHSTNDELIVILWWCKLVYLYFKIITTFKFTQFLTYSWNRWMYFEYHLRSQCKIEILFEICSAIL